jgi:N6-L-threonylcarbamoyladenine synthase
VAETPLSSSFVRSPDVAHLLSSQIGIHKQYGGIVPELACRRHMEVIGPLVDELFHTAHCSLSQLDAVAVTVGPGLIGALLVGVSFAKALSYALRIPLLPVHHLEGHIAAVFLEHGPLLYPSVALVVSGGHTNLYRVDGPGIFQLLGKTRDDAAGEAFDKGARMLGLEYPGGPIIDRLSKEGDPSRFPFALPLQEGLDFSFSGLKTALMRLLSKQEDHKTISLPDIAASYQKAIVGSLVQKSLAAVKQVQARGMILVGGVAANSELRREMKDAAERHGVALYVPSAHYCTDNAAMIAMAGRFQFERRHFAPLDISPHPHLELS